MELLDAAIALAVTLAALATTVTIIMELVVRVFGLKSKGQIELFMKIYETSFTPLFKGDAKASDFVKKILDNPLRDDSTQPKWMKSIKEDAAGKSATSIGLLSMFGTKSLRVYDWVSTEHVFRRILELDGVKSDSHTELVRKLKEFNLKYNEMCGAASAQFKNNRQSWSVLIGVFLALVINVNGLRIFETFLEKPELAAAMVAEMDDLVKESEAAKESLDKVLAEKGEEDIEDFNERLEIMNTQLAGLQGKGIPIGWSYAPHCHLVDWWFSRGLEAGDPVPATKCSEGQAVSENADPTTAKSGPGGLAAAIFIIFVTGLLIGLGAPFWFDLAKRLAQVRSMFRGKGTSEEMYSGETPKAGGLDDEEKTNKLINKVVSEALAKGVTSRRLFVERREI